MSTSPTPITSSPRHPPGLYTLFFTEMWERCSFYGMRGLLVLFMKATVEKHGLEFSIPMAGAIYGLYTAAVYLAALPGGWVADRLIGAQRAVLCGGALIACGQCTLAIPRKDTFFLGLLLVVIGTGLLKPNISAIVGKLYPEGGARRDAGFTIFYMGINLGSFIGPLVCGPLGEKINWHLGFAAAGLGMIGGLVQFALMRGRLLGAGAKPEVATVSRRDWNLLSGALAGLALLAALIWSGVVPISVSSRFSKDDFVNLPTLAEKLKQPADGVSAWIRTQLSPGTLETLANYHGPGSDPGPFHTNLVHDLNRIIGRQSIYDVQRFNGVALRSKTQQLLKQTQPHLDEVPQRHVLLNRLLLEDAYPLQIAKSPLSPVEVADAAKWIIVALAAFTFLRLFFFSDLTGVEKKRIGVVAVLFVAAVTFFAGLEQAGSSLNLFADQYTNRMLGTYEMPASWFQAINPLFVVLLGPVAAGLWVALSKRGRDLSLGMKFASGLLLLAVGYVVIAVGAQRAVAGPVWPVWLLFMYLLHTMGELCVSPVGLSSITKLAPARMVGQIMGLWFMATALGNLMAGLIAGESTSAKEMSGQFWWIAIAAAAIAVLLMFMARPMRRWMAGIN